MPTLLTRQVIDAARSNTRVFDSDVRGLALRVSRGGEKSFVYRYRHNGQRREIALGSAADLTASQARIHARRMSDRLAGGEDPLAAKTEATRAAKELRERETLATFRATYQRTASKKRLTVESDDSIFDKWILPLLGSVPIAEVGPKHAQQLHAFVTEAGFPIRANRAHALLSNILTVAARRGLREAPLPRGVVIKNPETKRERYLSEVEFARLWRTLTAMQARDSHGQWGVHANAAAALKVIMLTGCRKREILQLRWSEVDSAGQCLHLADTKTGRRVVQLGAAALELIEARRPAEDDSNASAFVFPQADGEAPIADCKRAWAYAIKAAKLSDVRVHDLRHSLAAQAIAAGATHYELKNLLGHLRQETTARYAHVGDPVARAAADKVAARLAQITAAADGLRAVS
jgi:integrase